ncbi:putative PNPOx domain-containing protein [Favolaschia claudopus]|uniref:PNPOx domain-containing protein n=1 Tax=Favolaschia claudopus TaxID=2862362 RepID=A0AAW0A5F2_9AGAR
MALNGWHRGENEIHRKLNTIDDFTVARLYLSIDGDLPGDHAHFHCNNLPFLPVTTLDESGRPWGSILAGKEGKPGFITRGSRYSTLRIDASLWDGEPLLENSKLFKKQDQTMLLAGIGIEFGTRRRNKFAGIVSQLNQEDERRMQLDVSVNEAIGNCPKYINIRDLVPHPDTNPSIALQKSKLSLKDRLPEEVIAFITASDTVFFGTTYKAFDRDALQFPSHLGMNQRGGRPGFMRVVPSDGRTVRHRLRPLTFVDFETGDILYLTGHAENLVGADALKLMPFQKTLTTVYVTGYTLVRDALPVRQRQGTSPERSPYSPPIRLLAEESPTSSLLNTSDKATALLTRIDLHAPSIATFTFDSSVDLHIKPGQAVIMDMSPLVGVPAYRHMAPGKPTSLNDDSIRTWTVSSASLQSTSTRVFSLTMREKQGGAVTGPVVKPEILGDSRPLELRVGIVGVTGDFVLPSSQSASTSAISDTDLGLMVPLAADGPPPKKMLWVAGGIGITPFLSMLKALSHADDAAIRWDIRFLLATREPEILVPLVADALSAANGSTANLDISLEVFSTKEDEDTEHAGRMPVDFFQTGSEEMQGREVYLCGSPEFEKAALAALVRGRVVESAVKREGFEY